MKYMIEKYDDYDPKKIREIALKTYGDKSYASNIKSAITSIISAKD